MGFLTWQILLQMGISVVCLLVVATLYIWTLVTTFSRGRGVLRKLVLVVGCFLGVRP